jgi:hypothetical protein
MKWRLYFRLQYAWQASQRVNPIATKGRFKRQVEPDPRNWLLRPKMISDWNRLPPLLAETAVLVKPTDSHPITDNVLMHMNRFECRDLLRRSVRGPGPRLAGEIDSEC